MMGNTSNEFESEPTERSVVTTLRQIVTWFPVVILPGATWHQLWSAYQAQTVEGLSAITWVMFFFANIGALWLGHPHTRMEKFKVVCAFGLTALLDVLLVILILLRGAD